jgi:hypothetical protein
MLQMVKSACRLLVSHALVAVETNTPHMVGCLRSEPDVSCTRYTLSVEWMLWYSSWCILDAHTHA